MFQIHHHYHGKEGVLKYSRATPDLYFKGKTSGLALKYVAAGEEIYKIQDNVIKVPSGHFILLPENVPYQARSCKQAAITEGMCLDIFQWRGESLFGSTLLFTVPYPMWGSFQTLSPVTKVSDGQQALTDFSKGLETFIQSVLKLESGLLSHTRNKETQKKLASILLKTEGYIRQNHHKKISLDALAKCVGLSKFHLIRLYKNCLGHTPHEFQMQLRMEKARELLTQPGSITSIALALGFHDSAAFSNQFRKFHQMSPRTFRSTLA